MGRILTVAAASCRRALCLVACVSLAPALADLDGFRDPVDGRLDASQWLLDRKGFLPVPIIVTEPAVGYGGGAAALFFHRNEQASGSERLTPPDISAIAAFGTENGSKGGGLGHLGFSADHRWRYLAAAGNTSLNLTWYGAPGIEGGAREDGLAFNMEGSFAIGDLRRRIGDGDWWVGARYIGLQMASRFGSSQGGGISSRELDSAISGLGLVVEHDGRDNIFTPNRGTRLQLQALRFSERIGSDHDYGHFRGALHHFMPLGSRVVVGLRADMQAVDGDVPFYARPFIELRGIPLMRYQGDRIATLEAEGRWDLDGRWSAVAFAGAARAAARAGGLGSAETQSTFGIGGRYLLARQLGLHAGIDVARGPEKTAIYLVIGSAWR